MGRWVGLGVAWLLFACSNGAKETAGPSDAGATSDAGKTSDAGPSGDAGTSGDAGPRPAADAGNDAGITLAAACGHYFDVNYGGKCQHPSIAADELARIRPRYVRWCESDRSRPGLSYTAERLDACASALAADECYGSPVVCDAVVGTLPAGAMVNGRDQCQSNQAFPNATSADAGLMLPDCGTCSAVIPIGQSCADASAGACAQGSLCSRQDPAICVAYTQGDIGASCGASQTDLCKLGLICGADKKCT